MSTLDHIFVELVVGLSCEMSGLRIRTTQMRALDFGTNAIEDRIASGNTNLVEVPIGVG